MLGSQVGQIWKTQNPEKSVLEQFLTHIVFTSCSIKVQILSQLSELSESSDFKFGTFPGFQWLFGRKFSLEPFQSHRWPYARLKWFILQKGSFHLTELEL